MANVPFTWLTMSSAGSAAVTYEVQDSCTTSTTDTWTAIDPSIQWRTLPGGEITPGDWLTCDCDATGAPFDLQISRPQIYFGPAHRVEQWIERQYQTGAAPGLVTRGPPELPVDPADAADALRYAAAAREWYEREPRPPRVDIMRDDREAAERRALELLESHLTEDQRRQLQRLRCFRVVTRSGRVYEIDADERMHNVYELDGRNRRVNELCIYQQGGLPLADNTLAQKLLLEADEAEFRRIANHRPMIPLEARA